MSKTWLFKGLISTEKEFQPVSNKYAYTKQDVEKVFHEMEEALFASRTPGAGDESVPKMLVVVGVEGAGKTHLLNELLKTSRYSNYVPLYEPEYRTRHPHYDEIEKHGVVYAYKQTEAFVRDLGAMIFEKTLEDKYSIIMEAGLETREFAGFQTGEHACLYEYEVHVIASKKDFAHVDHRAGTGQREREQAGTLRFASGHRRGHGECQSGVDCLRRSLFQGSRFGNYVV